MLLPDPEVVCCLAAVLSTYAITDQIVLAMIVSASARSVLLVI